VGDNLLREEVLLGEDNILQYMMRNNMLERYYTEAIGYPILNNVGTGLMAQLSHKFPRMNILEVGAGTGSATASILGRIGEAYTSYTYTDISSGFFERAGERFQGHAHKMVFKTLDISKDPIAQGFNEQGYDVVVATNVLHATTPLKETLRNARRLLKSGGYLVNMELAQSDAMRFTLVVGCLPGWWVGEDDGRKGGPLLTPAHWESILAETGFAVETISEQLDLEDA
jgi:SAM-dependent methyltransferase